MWTICHLDCVIGNKNQCRLKQKGILDKKKKVTELKRSSWPLQGQDAEK